MSNGFQSVAYDGNMVHSVSPRLTKDQHMPTRLGTVQVVEGCFSPTYGVAPFRSGLPQSPCVLALVLAALFASPGVPSASIRFPNTAGH
jgi:hypothetical protein